MMGIDSILEFIIQGTVAIGELFQSLLGPWWQTFQQKAMVLFENITGKRVVLEIVAILIALGPLNWLIWIIRRFRSTLYRPFVGKFDAKTSVVIPVYKEKKETLQKVVDAIIRNKPDEIILILDVSERALMNFVKETYPGKVNAYFIEEPGKRPALAKGIKLTKHEIVVLVDSDTYWESNNFLQQLIIPFQDPGVGGVGTRQAVATKKTWGHKIIDWNLDLKYTDYVPSDSLSGSVLCLSGRTAAYRKKVIEPDLDQLTQEYFLGHHCMGGDDTRLTSMVLRKGYRTVYQSTAVAKTDFDPSFWKYLRQKVRWSRNSFRAYLRAIFSTWPWRQRRWYYLIAAYHTVFPGLIALIGIFFFFYALYLQQYALVYLWLVWIFVSRAIKSYSHLKKSPKDIFLIPIVVMYYYFLSLIKLYALLTMTWETWAGSREEYTIKDGKRIAAARSIS